MATITVEGGQLKIVNGSNIDTIPIDDVVVESVSGGIRFKQCNAPITELQRSSITSPTSTSVEDLINQIGGLINVVQGIENTIYVNSKSDLPTASGGVITLDANKTYYFTTDVDLTGDRLVGGQDTVILGPSSENSSITSTGLGEDVALFTTEWTTPIRHITFKDVDTCLDIDGVTNAPVALDWTGVNFQNVPNIGTINQSDNFIFTKGAFLNSKGLTFSGTIGTIAFINSIFTGDGAAGSIFDLSSTLTITRRFRIIYSSLIAFGSTVGITLDASATIPVQGIILDTMNFGGGGTYLSGIDYQDNKALFGNNVGITNSREVSQYYMNGNTTVTPISGAGDTQKVRGTTTSGTYTSKFTNTDNRATYTGAITKTFKVTAVLSFTSGTNDIIGSYIAKNGTIIPESEVYQQTDTNGDFASCAIQALVELDTNDYIEIFVENSSDASDITVTDLNVIVE